jgi:hypothetical protein
VLAKRGGNVWGSGSGPLEDLERRARAVSESSMGFVYTCAKGKQYMQVF